MLILYSLPHLSTALAAVGFSFCSLTIVYLIPIWRKVFCFCFDVAELNETENADAEI